MNRDVDVNENQGLLVDCQSLDIEISRKDRGCTHHTILGVEEGNLFLRNSDGGAFCIVEGLQANQGGFVCKA